MSELIWLTATEQASLIRRREVSAVELLQAHLAQIEAVNPQLNAIITYLPELAIELAQAADAKQARGEALGVLHGLPIAHKDLFETAGIRSTMGSPVFADYVPETDDLIIARLKAAGCITLGKTNVPEFGAGSHTFNPVFGATKNPYDLARACGGSSGGAAVALAAGMVPIADGSDMGGSLRNPASFNNVVGLRPTPGRVPQYPKADAWSTLSVDGPMGRTVQDVALMLRAIAGPDDRAPISLDAPATSFADDLRRDFQGARIAWSRDLGCLPVEPSVIETIEAQLPVFADIGIAVENAHPDFSDAYDIFHTLRAWGFELAFSEHFAQFGEDSFKETIRWNAAQGKQLSAAQISRAQVKRTELFHRVREFLDVYDCLLLPTAQVPPFPIEQEYPREINGAPMQTYIDWMMSCGFITVTGLPAISVPCGFTSDGLPVGLQMVGKPRGELALLQLAYAFQEVTRFYLRSPPIAERAA
ncbi:MAG: amidase [Chloroflexi bacterium]|nr:amidase [Chloroflexota bacterium]MYC56095.1 amidase [Chloroflexota bacterium]MYD37424.1 amidase [Chloroflexota bacterium]MYE78099.1 amidase [Chloroflexota bacterium]